MAAALYLEQSGARVRRWLGAGMMAVALHAGMGFSVLWWLRHEPEEMERRGAVTIELTELAAESPSDQQTPSQELQLQTAAPPPQPFDDPEETPPPEAPVAKEAPPEPQQEVAKATDVSPPEAAPPEPQPPREPVAVQPEAAQPKEEPTPQQADVPKVEAAPLAPNPEVVLPEARPVETPPVETPKTQPQPVEQKQPVEKKRVAEPPKAAQPSKSDRQRARKSNSKARREAAPSAKGAWDPNPIYRASPAYPASARASRVQGVVVVSYTIAPSGAVTNVSIVSASPPGVFNSATVAAVSQWRFKPPGQAIRGRRTTIRFKLR